MASQTLSVSAFQGQAGSFHCWPTEEVPATTKSFKLNGYIQGPNGWTPAVVKPTDDKGMETPLGSEDGPTPWTLLDSRTGQPGEDIPKKFRVWAREYSEVDESSPDADTLNTAIVEINVRRDGEAGIGLMHRASTLPHLSRMILEDCHLTAQGVPSLPHIDRSRAPWFKSAAQIRRRYQCSQEQAETLAEAFRILDTTAKMAVTFDKWIKTRGIEAGLKYFEGIAVQMVLVTDEGDPILDLMTPDQKGSDVATVDEGGNRTVTVRTLDLLAKDEELELEEEDVEKIVNLVDRLPIDVARDHLLDDPRDDFDRWEDRQPERFRSLLANIRTATLPQLKALGRYPSELNSKAYSKTQVSVLWDEYNRRKIVLTPKPRPHAVKIFTRFADRNANLAKAAQWLSGEGAKVLNETELATAWNCYKAAKKSRAPKQTSM